MTLLFRPSSGMATSAWRRRSPSTSSRETSMLAWVPPAGRTWTIIKNSASLRTFYLSLTSYGNTVVDLNHVSTWWRVSWLVCWSAYSWGVDLRRPQRWVSLPLRQLSGWSSPASTTAAVSPPPTGPGTCSVNRSQTTMLLLTNWLLHPLTGRPPFNTHNSLYFPQVTRDFEQTIRSTLTLAGQDLKDSWYYLHMNNFLVKTVITHTGVYKDW